MVRILQVLKVAALKGVELGDSFSEGFLSNWKRYFVILMLFLLWLYGVTNR